MRIWIWALLAAPWLQAADVYPVSGKVINTSTNAAFPGAHVIVTRENSNRTAASMVADGGGRFEFNLPEGRYHLYAGRRDFLEIFGKSRPDATVGSAIFVGAKLDTTDLIFRWYPPVAISGKVVDNNSEPVHSALIQLVRSNIAAGRRVTTTAGWAYTDDLGEYRFGGLSPGTFYLVANGEPWYAKPALTGEPVHQPKAAYRTLYFPNVYDANHAAPIVLAAGAEARADFVFTEAVGASVKVTYTVPSGFRGTVALMADGIGTAEAFQRESNAYGNQSIWASVPPGHYRVRVLGTAGNTSVGGRQEIDVNGIDTEVDVKVSPYAKVTGKVEFPDATSKPAGSLLVNLVKEPPPGLIGTQIHSDGSYSFPAAIAGRYRVTLRAPGFFASDIRVAGADFHDGLVSLENGETATISIVASDEMGSVKGLLTRGGKLVIGGMVVLAPVDGSAERNPYRGFQTDSDGSFDFLNVKTGDYLLFATADIGLEYTNPAAVKPFLKDAKPVHVSKKAITEQNLVLDQ